MTDREIVCSECEAEFQIIHDAITDPEFCPFCGSKLRDIDDDDREWYDDEDENSNTYDP
jgi:rRNA maturation endonuclease Nob1